jgi:DNA-binding YbaB/EbfC family protein
MFPKGGMGGMYKKAQEMQKKMADIQSELSSMEVEGSSGGDMVKAIVSGEKKILSLNLDPDILNEDKEMLEDLILVAINQAIEKVDSISKEKMGSLTGGMNIPGLF